MVKTLHLHCWCHMGCWCWCSVDHTLPSKHLEKRDLDWGVSPWLSGASPYGDWEEGVSGGLDWGSLKCVAQGRGLLPCSKGNLVPSLPMSWCIMGSVLTLQVLVLPYQLCQQEPTVEHREQYSIYFNNLHGKQSEKKLYIYIVYILYI